MLEEWWRPVVTLVAGSAIWMGVLKFLGSREFGRIDAAIQSVASKADAAETTAVLNRCIDRLTALEVAKADRVEIVAAMERLERMLELQNTARERMHTENQEGRRKLHEDFAHHVKELHKVDRALERVIGRMEALQPPAAAAPSPPTS